MNQESEKYYLIFESWSLDPNQWSIVMDGTAVLLAVFGVLLGFYLYRKQRMDNSYDAFDYFQSSLPELIQSIEKAIDDLESFNRSLDLDTFVNPILSASLNDKFLSKIDLIHLNRFYSHQRQNKLSNFKQLLVDSNFFGNYHSYISQEINFFRTHFQNEKNRFSEWRLLRSTQFFSKNPTENENSEYKEFYSNWVKTMNERVASVDFNKDEPSGINNRNAVLENEIETLVRRLSEFVDDNQNADQASLLAHNVILAYDNMVEMKASIRTVLENDIKRFKSVLINMKTLSEDN